MLTKVTKLCGPSEILMNRNYNHISGKACSSYH